jgi:hypothetical protein
MEVSSVTFPVTAGVRAEAITVELFDEATNCGDTSSITFPQAAGVRAQAIDLDVIHYSLPEKVVPITFPTVTGVRGNPLGMEVFDLTCAETTSLCQEGRGNLYPTYTVRFSRYEWTYTYGSSGPGSQETVTYDLVIDFLNPDAGREGKSTWGTPATNYTNYDRRGCWSWQGQLSLGNGDEYTNGLLVPNTPHSTDDELLMYIEASGTDDPWTPIAQRSFVGYMGWNGTSPWDNGTNSVEFEHSANSSGGLPNIGGEWDVMINSQPNGDTVELIAGGISGGSRKWFGTEPTANNFFKKPSSITAT